MGRLCLLAVLIAATLLPGAGAIAGGRAEATQPAADGVRPQVVLVHGIWDTAAAFDRMVPRIVAAGWQVHAVSLRPNDGSAELEALAEQLRQFTIDQLGPSQRFSIVAFSMGGLVARFYVQRLGGLERMTHFITISTPHHGTSTAYLESLPGVLEMRPDSPFLRDLDRDADRLGRISMTSIWSPLDIVISPATSSRVAFGRDVQIPVLLHSSMLSDERVITATIAALQL